MEPEDTVDHAIGAIFEVEIDPVMAEDCNRRLNALRGDDKIQMAELIHRLVCCFDPAEDSAATLLIRNRGILSVVGVNAAPGSAAMMTYMANEVLNANNAPPARGMWH